MIGLLCGLWALLRSGAEMHVQSQSEDKDGADYSRVEGLMGRSGPTPEPRTSSPEPAENTHLF